MAEKYRLLEQQIRKRSSLYSKIEANKPSADGMQLSAQSRAVNGPNDKPVQQKLSARMERQNVESVQPMCVKLLNVQSTGTQQHTISSAFPRSASMERHLIDDDTVESPREDNFIPSAPCVIPTCSVQIGIDSATDDQMLTKCRSRSADGVFQQLCRTNDKHQRDACISSRGYNSVQQCEYKFRPKQSTNTNRLRKINKNKTICFHYQIRFMITIPQQLHLHVESCKTSPEQIVSRMTITEMNPFRFHLDPDTGQRLAVSRKTHYSNEFETKVGKHSSVLSSCVYVGCQNSNRQPTVKGSSINKGELRNQQTHKEAVFMLSNSNSIDQIVFVFPSIFPNSHLSMLMCVPVIDLFCEPTGPSMMSSAHLRTKISPCGIGVNFLPELLKNMRPTAVEQYKSSSLSAQRQKRCSRCHSQNHQRYCLIIRNRMRAHSLVGGLVWEAWWNQDLKQARVDLDANDSDRASIKESLFKAARDDV